MHATPRRRIRQRRLGLINTTGGGGRTNQRSSKLRIASRSAGVSAVLTMIIAAPAWAHGDKGGEDRYEGPGFSGAAGGQPAINFTSRGVDLLAWIPLPDFDGPVGSDSNAANDIWGYVSPSGSEYAIIGLQRGVGFVDVTTPTDPQIVAGFSASFTTWRDIKTFGHHAYVVADGSAKDLQVYDLSQIDSGTVTLANTVTTTPTHNVAIDTASGYLYRTGSTGSAAKGLMIYDLNADPVNPPLVGQWADRYVHDAQVVTYTSGPNAGKQVAFAFAENGTGGADAALDILDVTDKSNIQLISRTPYSNNGFSHQGWLSTDGQYVYLNDEFDESKDPDIASTTTRVIDVGDLANPFEVGTFTNGNRAVDHNLFTRDGLIYEANYRSGLRVFDASNPVAPVEVAFFDTQPGSDNPNFTGLWGNYPFLPSGIVLGSDIGNGLFIWQVNAQPARAWGSQTTGGSWTNGSNWATGTAPGADDAVLIAAQQNLTVTVSGATASIYSLSLSSNPGGVPTLRLQSGATLEVENYLIVDGRSRLTGSGTVAGRVLGATRDSRIEATGSGSLTLGDASQSRGFINLGTLDVGSATVTLLASGQAQAGHLVTLAGGTLTAPNGVQLVEDDELRGFGTVSALYRTAADTTTVADGGDLTLGHSGQANGVRFMAGSLAVGSHRVTLLESNEVELNAVTTTLGSGGVLAAPTGMILPVNKTIDASGATGGASIEGAFTNHGQVDGPTAGGAFLTFQGDVTGGEGGYSGNLRFNAVFRPGGRAEALSAAAVAAEPSGGPLEANEAGDEDAASHHDGPSGDQEHAHGDTDTCDLADGGGSGATAASGSGGALGMAVNGDLSFGPSADFQVQIGASGHDEVTVSGDATLNGTLTIELTDGLTPQHGDRFTVLTAGQIGGGFTGYEGDVFDLGSGNLALVPVVDETADELTVVATVPGDTNGDLVVGFVDFLAFQGNFGLDDRTWFDGDFNGDEEVNFVDFVLFQGNFGTDLTQSLVAGLVIDDDSHGGGQPGHGLESCGPLTTTSTPEPGTAVMVAGLLAAGWLRRGRLGRGHGPFSG